LSSIVRVGALIQSECRVEPVQLGHRAGFAAEAVGEVLVHAHFQREQFDGEEAIQLDLPRLIDRAHAAAASRVARAQRLCGGAEEVCAESGEEAMRQKRISVRKTPKRRSWVKRAGCGRAGWLAEMSPSPHFPASD